MTVCRWSVYIGMWSSSSYAFKSYVNLPVTVVKAQPRSSLGLPNFVIAKGHLCRNHAFVEPHVLLTQLRSSCFHYILLNMLEKINKERAFMCTTIHLSIYCESSIAAAVSLILHSVVSPIFPISSRMSPFHDLLGLGCLRGTQSSCVFANDRQTSVSRGRNIRGALYLLCLKSSCQHAVASWYHVPYIMNWSLHTLHNFL